MKLAISKMAAASSKDRGGKERKQEKTGKREIEEKKARWAGFWRAELGSCVKLGKRLLTNSVGLGVQSPPLPHLLTNRHIFFHVMI